MLQPGQVRGENTLVLQRNALAPSNDTLMYIQWMPGSLAAVLPPMLVLTGALLTGILEAPGGQGHKLSSSFFHLALLQTLSLSSSCCSFPGHKQGPCETARRICVCASLLPGVVSMRTLFLSLSAPGAKPAVWLPLHHWNRRAGEPAARSCNPRFWPHCPG